MTETTTMADTTKQSTTLLEFLNNEASPEERTAFTDSWQWYIRQVLGVTRESRHVWPYNIDFALRATLANVTEAFTSNDNLDDALNALDERNRNTDGFANVPGTIGEMIEETKVKDPYSFPDDSMVYRNWKTINSVIPIIDQSISNLELQTRQLTKKNAETTAQIDRIGKLIFVQNGFVEKFKLVANSKNSQN